MALTSKKKYECELCEMSFDRTVKLTRHINAIHRGESFKNKSDTCEKTFRFPSYLSDHITKVHDRFKNFKCDSCEKSFTIDSELIEQIKSAHK